VAAERRNHLPRRAVSFGTLVYCAFVLLWAATCFAKEADGTNSAVNPPAAETNAPPVRHILTYYGYTVVKEYPHDTNAFTQGLLFTNGVIYESTGLEGRSSLRKVEWQTGKVLQETNVPPQYFAEGLAMLDGKLYQLTWQHHKGFVYDATNFALLKEFSYEGEGWGLTTDGESLIMSDGTATIRYLDPSDFHVKRSVKVQHDGQPVERLNELEFVKGEIYANVWQTDFMLRISPATGEVLGVADLHGLLSTNDWTPQTDVLNGIAFDSQGDRLFVTGKLWPKLFEIRLTPK
jgi:glutamine cyclotransferase